MNKLVITLTKQNGIVEQSVPNTVIKTLYDLGIADDLSPVFTYGVDTDDPGRPIGSISGAIQVSAAFDNQLEYVRNKYPNLDITATATYISFADPKVELYLMAAGLGDGVGITTTEAATAEIGSALKGKTDITSFNEFRYFTKCNTNPGLGLYFAACTNLASIDLTNCTSIRDSQFYGTALTTINIPNLLSVAKVNHFRLCTNLTTILSLGNITTIPEAMFYGCSNLQTINFPQSCVLVDRNAFYDDLMLSLDVSNLRNLTSVGAGAFLNCYNLYGELDLPNLTNASNAAFGKCARITSIKCLGSISSFPSQFIFAYLSSVASLLATIKIPYECTSFGGEALRNCGSLTSIKQYDKSLSDYEEGETPIFNSLSRVTSYGNGCFWGCSNLVLTLNDISATISIGNNTFLNTKFGGAISLGNVTSLGTGSFLNTLITSVDFTGSILTTIPHNCFTSCSNLTTITLPSAIKTIEYGNFAGCDSLLISLSDIYYVEELTGYRDGGVFRTKVTNSGRAAQLLNSSTLYLPNLKKADHHTFGGQLGIVTVNLPALEFCGSIKTFEDCTNLQEVISLGNITEFNTWDSEYGGNGVFLGCSALTKVNLPNVRNLPMNIFHSCTALSDLNIPTSITSISQAAFYKTNSLTNKVMYFPNVTKLSLQCAFGNTAGMHIYLPGQLEYLNERSSTNGLFVTTPGALPFWDLVGPTSLFYRRYLSGMTNPYTRMFYLKDVTNIQACTFYGANIDIVVINNTTIPTLTATTDTSLISNVPNVNTLMFAGATIGDLYVPDAALLSYIDSPLFADLAAANKIKALSTCPRVTVAQAEAGNNGIIEDYM